MNTVSETLEAVQKKLANDKEYWEAIEDFRRNMNNAIDRWNTAMASEIIRLVCAMILELNKSMGGEDDDKE